MYQGSTASKFTSFSLHSAGPFSSRNTSKTFAAVADNQMKWKKNTGV
jgi:hypothetical protein